jgi:hypothetical protein
VFP